MNLILFGFCNLEEFGRLFCNLATLLNTFYAQAMVIPWTIQMLALMLALRGSTAQQPKNYCFGVSFSHKGPPCLLISSVALLTASQRDEQRESDAL